MSFRSLTTMLALATISTSLVAAAIPAQEVQEVQEVQDDDYSLNPKECVILLHGLSRTDFSMLRMERTLEESGYVVANVHYDSREHLVEDLASPAIEEGLQSCRAQGARRIHFTTHSLGGILVRYYMQTNDIAELGRVVMLAPPNQGSQIIDVLSRMPGFELFSGEPARQLGTGPNSLVNTLPEVNFEVGVIAGNRSMSPFFSLALPDRDDGKVSVESTKVAGMRDFIEVPYSHTFIMQREEVMDQVKYFLKNGRFVHAETDSNPASVIRDAVMSIGTNN
jgi:triacylglycerol lipase